jgi:hypothetical protein
MQTAALVTAFLEQVSRFKLDELVKSYAANFS